MEAVLKNADQQHEYASLEEIGKTAENRSLWLLKVISQDPTLPIIWIDAGIHAREWISSATAFYTIDKLLSKDGKHLLGMYQFYIAPNVNPDGYVYSYTRDRLWRKNRSKNDRDNCPGTDINRNFPYKWGLKGAADDECTGSYRGKSAADQLETQHLIKKLTSVANHTKLFLTLHAYGQMILMPYGYESGARPTNFEELKRIALKLVFKLWGKHNTIYSTGAPTDLLYPASGGSFDFTCGTLKIPYSFAIELPDTGTYGFLLPPSFIGQIGEQMWDALQVFVEEMK
ncbi:unnamed protein product [Rodentolepis nana]|uniref:Peptidase_M14 domain-containing protein n=1 Tax=Rodentolepis nana TaxID=102285 RepID=A0A0R3TCK7_RODNA|nr:unnamed protein product [Rodentolepis nana]